MGQDFGIAGLFADMMRRMQCETIDPLWAERMLQRIIEGDRAGDCALFCKTFLRLKRPTHADMARLLEVKNTLRESPFGERAREAVSRINISSGPDSVEVVKVSKTNLFRKTLENLSEGVICDKAHDYYGLVPTPEWVVAAVALHSLDGLGVQVENFQQMNVCCDPNRVNRLDAFNVIHGPQWWIHVRHASRGNPWDDMTWLMAKPW